MSTVIDIRGTHGSGKSTVVRTLLEQYSSIPIIGHAYPGHPKHENKKGHLGYLIQDFNAVVLGRYDTACGGCDGIKTADEVQRRIYHFAGQYQFVILEGILVAHTFQRYHDIAKDLAESGVQYHFCFLNTPLRTCVARVRARRLAKGNSKPLDPKNVQKDHARIWGRLRKQAQEAELSVVELPYRDPMAPVLELLDPTPPF